MLFLLLSRLIDILVLVGSHFLFWGFMCKEIEGRLVGLIDCFMGRILVVYVVFIRRFFARMLNTLLKLVHLP